MKEMKKTRKGRRGNTDGTKPNQGKGAREDPVSVRLRSSSAIEDGKQGYSSVTVQHSGSAAVVVDSSAQTLVSIVVTSQSQSRKEEQEEPEEEDEAEMRLVT